jgi:methylthioribose-1-phosphate isomerase
MAGVPHAEPLSGASYSAVELSPENDRLILLDQRRLPDSEEYQLISEWEAAAEAIRNMVVRGAPAIGIAAAYAMVLATRRVADAYELALSRAAQGLLRSRPTAVNLRWAVEQCNALAREHAHQTATIRTTQMAELARQIHRQDVAANRKIGLLGAAAVPDGATVLTHCNAGALATGGYGTALGIIRAAHESGKRIQVIADETRPFLQGSRLTAWELARDGIDVTLIADVAAGYLLAQGAVDLVIVGSDRIAANGDVANKIGTHTLACLCQQHGRPFYVAAPFSTVDLAMPDGTHIPIEERSANEVTHFAERRIAASGVSAKNPAFDVTPAAWITAIYTERGMVSPVSTDRMAALGNLEP